MSACKAKAMHNYVRLSLVDVVGFILCIRNIKMIREGLKFWIRIIFIILSFELYILSCPRFKIFEKSTLFPKKLQVFIVGCVGSLLLPRGWHNSHMSYTAFLPYSKQPYSLAFQLSGQQESHFWLLLIQDKKQRYTDSGIKTKIIMAYSAVGANDVEPILERTLLLKQEACIYKIPSSQVSWSGMCSF